MDQARTARLLFCPNTKNVFWGETAIFLWRHHRKTQSASRATAKPSRPPQNTAGQPGHHKPQPAL